MLLSIQTENGGRRDAVVLAAGRDRMRLVADGASDTIEITLLGGQWYDEGGRRIAIDALIAIDGVDYSDVCPRAMTAGRAFWD